MALAEVNKDTKAMAKIQREQIKLTRETIKDLLADYRKGKIGVNSLMQPAFLLWKIRRDMAQTADQRIEAAREFLETAQIALKSVGQLFQAGLDSPLNYWKTRLQVLEGEIAASEKDPARARGLAEDRMMIAEKYFKIVQELYQARVLSPSRALKETKLYLKARLGVCRTREERIAAWKEFHQMATRLEQFAKNDLSIRFDRLEADIQIAEESSPAEAEMEPCPSPPPCPPCRCRRGFFRCRRR